MWKSFWWPYKSKRFKWKFTQSIITNANSNRLITHDNVWHDYTTAFINKETFSTKLGPEANQKKEPQAALFPLKYEE